MYRRNQPTPGQLVIVIKVIVTLANFCQKLGLNTSRSDQELEVSVE